MCMPFTFHISTKKTSEEGLANDPSGSSAFSYVVGEMKKKTSGLLTRFLYALETFLLYCQLCVMVSLKHRVRYNSKHVDGSCDECRPLPDIPNIGDGNAFGL